ncbi:hypothetical protein SAMN04489727_5854 [Amycolatopsis tolypomycina]|uniref:Uncharacterized protein n=1 Tax=Amycolatopsis tolypomycina TaxID=208445 RepID=A0A1H4WXT1_9PSEU|nr:hypothetical protein [Amycolatopsis tolypomycina]SEC98119.1 hypothetical protein SAMN04489727_5854 [Amycolatopsis tolypomycina]
MAVNQDSSSNTDDDHELERKAHIAADKGFPWVRWGVIVAIIGVAVTVVGVVAGCQPREPGTRIDGDNNGPIVNGDNNVVNIQAATERAAEVAGTDDTKFKEELKKLPGAGERPASSAPWPYAVVDTGTDGLLARDGNVAKASPVGHAANRALIWVDCIATSDFTPPMVTGENNVGPKWAKVRWRHLAQPTDRGISDPKQPQTAWMYLGALAPIGHNGQIPACTG